MKVFILALFSGCIASANIYDTLKDFSYIKQSNKNIKIQKAQIIDVYDDNNEKCMKILIEDNNISVLEFQNKCLKFKNNDFYSFLNNEFLKIYNSDLNSTNKYLWELKNIIKDIMVSYKINKNFNIKSNNVKILNLNNKDGGIILFKVNNQDCAYIKIFKENNKMKMSIEGIENLDKECKIFIDSPDFKNLSYTNNSAIIYDLE